MAALKRRAAKMGYSPEHSMTHTVPPGFRTKGVSSLYNAEGVLTAQWVKSVEDPAAQEAFMREALPSSRT